MIPINNELSGQIRFLTTEEGGRALIALANALEEYHKDECTRNEGNALFRSQGIAQVAKWMKTLPDSLRKEL